VVLRDPRLVVVSTYYFMKSHNRPGLGDLDDFVARGLPVLCQWIAVRHILFSGIIRHQSIAFWYHDALADPLEWYYRFYDFVGLQLPHPTVNGAAEDAA
ncbi:unnamed protein product, partial [Scytosiphon promiscuus]